MATAVKKSQEIGKGKAGPGRPKGMPNKSTAALKDAILAAGEKVGSDMKGRGGMTGYLVFLAKTEPKAYAGLLGRIIPLQVGGEPSNPIRSAIEIRIVDPKR